MTTPPGEINLQAQHPNQQPIGDAPPETIIGEADPGVHYVKREDGRRLAYDVIGNPKGPLTIVCPDTPSGRLEPVRRSSKLYRDGLQVARFDPAGWGESGRKRQTPEQAAADVVAIADDLGVELFGVFGRAGGKELALATLALASERAVAGAILVGPEPAMLAKLRQDDNMKRLADAARKAGPGTAADIAFTSALDAVVERALESVKSLDAALGPKAAANSADAGIKARLLQSWRLAFAPGTAGLAGELMKPPFDIDLSRIWQDVVIGFGCGDTAAEEEAISLEHQLQRATIEYPEGDGHFEQTPKLLRQLGAVVRKVAAY